MFLSPRSGNVTVTLLGHNEEEPLNNLEAYLLISIKVTFDFFGGEGCLFLTIHQKKHCMNLRNDQTVPRWCTHVITSII